MNIPSVLASVSDGGSKSSYVTGTATPSSASKFVWCAVYSRRSLGAQYGDVSGMGLTWEPVAGTGQDSSARRLTLYRGYGSHSAGAVTVTFSSGHLACQAIVFETDAAVVRQVDTVLNQTTTDMSGSLSSFLDSGDCNVIHIAAHVFSGSQAASPQGSLSELSELLLASDNQTLGLYAAADIEDTSPGATISNTPVVWDSVSLELIPASSGPGVQLSYFSGSTSASYVTSSYTPESVQTYAVVQNRVSTGTADTATLSGNGLTWTSRGTYAAGLNRLTVFSASGTPSTGALTASFGGSQISCSVIVFTVPDTDGTAVQSKTGTASSSTAGVTFDSSFSSGSNVALLVANGNQDRGQPFSGDNGLLSLIATDGGSSDLDSNFIGYLVGEDSSPSATHYDSSSTWYALALELSASVLGLTGSLFQQGPTFFTGTVAAGAVDLTGTLFQQGPTFGTGQLDLNVTGGLFQTAPTFPTGTVSQAGQDLTGTLFQVSPTFNAGTIAAVYDLDGNLFQVGPNFNQGAITTGAAALVGVLFQQGPTFGTGTLSAVYELDGVLFQTAPSFSQGAVTVGAVDLAGALFQLAPTFPTGTITGGVRPRRRTGDVAAGRVTFGSSVSRRSSSATSGRKTGSL